jgi:hypothetical protein
MFPVKLDYFKNRRGYFGLAAKIWDIFEASGEVMGKYPPNFLDTSGCLG